MRHELYSTWRVFYFCFIQGAWSCLTYNMNLRHAAFSFLADAAVLNN